MPYLLLVEDDPFLGTMLRAVVEARGWTVDIATRCAEIGASGPQPDLVLLDMQLGSEDGLTALPDLTARGAKRIVAISADAGALRRAACAAPIERTMLKPIDLAVLETVLDEAAASA